MTSVRPKLKPETPKAITAWDTGSGKPVWMTKNGGWTHQLCQADIFVGEAAGIALKAAKNQETMITDPYFMEVNETGAPSGRELLREHIRAHGPSVPYGTSNCRSNQTINDMRKQEW